MTSRLKALVAALGLALLLAWILVEERPSREAAVPAAALPSLGSESLQPLQVDVVSQASAAISPNAISERALAPVEDAVAAVNERASSRCRLSGRLVDPEGQPLEGQLVQLYTQGPWPEDALAQPISRLSNLPGFEQSSDVAGRFVFEFVPPQIHTTLGIGLDPLRTRVNIQFTEKPVLIPENTVSQKPLGPGERDLGDLVLFPASAIQGRVSTPNGEPVQGARIRLTSGQFSFSEPTTISAADGSFVLGSIEDRRGALAITAPGYLGQELEPSDLIPGRMHGPFEVQLEPGALLTGRVVSTEGQALAGASLVLIPQTGGQATGGVDRTQTTSGPDGAFEARLMRRDRHQLLCSLPGYEEVDYHSEFYVDPGQNVEVSLVPVQATVFLVADKVSRSPIEFFRLEVFSVSSSFLPDSSPAGAAVSDWPSHPGGRTEAAAGPRNWVRVRAPGYAAFDGPVTWRAPGDRTCDVLLAPQARLRGQAFLEGRGAAHVGWDLTDARGWSRGGGVVDSAGRFEINELPPGVYGLRLAGGGAAGVRTGIELRPGTELDLGPIELLPAGSLRVLLLPPPGQSAAGLRLELGHERAGFAQVTDANGVASFHDLLPGRWELSFAGVEQRFDPSEPVEVWIAPQKESEVELQLTPLAQCRIEARFTSSGLGGAPVSLALLDSDAAAPENRPRTPATPPDANGLWAGCSSPRGRGTLVAQVESEPPWSWPSETLTLTPAAVLQTSLDLPAAELLLRWEPADDWPAELRLELELTSLETQATRGLQPLVQLDARARFDAGRPGRLSGPAAELLALGQLRWSALPPGRFSARLRLQTRDGAVTLRRYDGELALPKGGSSEVRLR
jgi:hypothetical protein